MKVEKELIKAKKDLQFLLAEIKLKITFNSNYDLDLRIEQCIEIIKSYFNDINHFPTRVNKIRAWIEAKNNINRCSLYLSLADNLKYCETKELQEKLNKINELVDKNYPFIYQNYN